ncbi:glycosyltransferase family 4 protein [Mobilicoccus caccae]|nr:glycosyltransferase [Mobilicoccus caccae]
MRVLMLVATTVATDTRVLREATTLVGAGHEVHIIGRSVPEDFVPPAGVSCSSVGTSSVFRAEGTPSLSGVRLPPHMRLARWILLPQHRNSAFGRWAAGAIADARGREFDVVHAHDYTALEAGARLAGERGVPYVYDTHELWTGRPREYRPTPLLDRRERRLESELGAGAAAVITVGEGVADALRERYGWDHVEVVRNTFPLSVQPRRGVADGPRDPDRHGPRGLVYAGRLAAFRELETVAEASGRLAQLGLPVTLRGPADATWLATFDRGTARIEPPAHPMR